MYNFTIFNFYTNKKEPDKNSLKCFLYLRIHMPFSCTTNLVNQKFIKYWLISAHGKDSRIIGGSEVPEGEMPYMVKNQLQSKL